MARIMVFINLSLDGVMQAPGRPDEDTRGDFPYGGWAVPYNVMSSGSGSGPQPGGLLFGRRTYEDFYSVWPKRTDGNPFTDILNNSPKYVASRTLGEPLPWMNSTLLKGDVAQTIPPLKQSLDRDLLILGSGDLVRSLMRHGLVDEVTLLIHPLVLGVGQRLFAEGVPYAGLRLAESRTTPTGVIIATYHPADPPV